MRRIKNASSFIVILIVAIVGLLRVGTVVAMGSGLTLSPMYQKIIVDPGEKQKVSFRISNPSSAVGNMYYELSVEPFYMDENGQMVYEAEGRMGEIAEWISFDVPVKGKIEPNGVEDIIFTIDVPRGAPAGGQYFSIMVTETGESEEDSDEEILLDNSKTAIKEIYRMAHLVYAEVTGSIVEQGEISDVELPSFLLSGNIAGSAFIKNTGNVHRDAVYTMQVFPLFSSEEVYTNDEKPETVTILPDRAVYHKTTWSETPPIGIFNVVYTVKFGESMEQISRMVIVCPIWLLFVVVFAVFAIIFYFMAKAKARKKTVQKAEKSA